MKSNWKTWLIIFSVFVVSFVGGFYVNPIFTKMFSPEINKMSVFFYNHGGYSTYMGSFPIIKPDSNQLFAPFVRVEVDTSIPIEEIVTNGILYKDGALIKVSKDEFENNESFMKWVDKNLIFCDENFQNPYLED